MLSTVKSQFAQLWGRSRPPAGSSTSDRSPNPPCGFAQTIGGDAAVLRPELAVVWDGGDLQGGGEALPLLRGFFSRL